MVRFRLRLRSVLIVLFGTGSASIAAFDFAELESKAEALAGESYVEPSKVPSALADLNYDQYRAIGRTPEGTLFNDEEVTPPFVIEFFHPGYLYDRTVSFNLVDPDSREARPFEFSTKYFDYSRLQLDDPVDADSITGFAGFKIAHPLNEGPWNFNEIGSFLGSSYFRLLGRNQRYGISARGLAINTSDPNAEEEFPAFVEYWIVEPRIGDKFLEVFALLDSPSVAGAFRFEIEPGDSTEARIDVSLFFRKKNPSIGLAPLTSMFWYGENHSPRPFADWRPEVHDSDGLLVQTNAGETIWRPLYNHHAVRHANLQAPDVRGFGLLQRDRDFMSYQDLDNPYHLVPSAWIETKGDWGDGVVRLVEIASDSEVMDNIVTFFAPESTPGAGDTLRYAYTLSWKMLDEGQLSPNRVVSTRVGEILEFPGTWRFVVDFEGPDLERLPPNVPVFAEITSSANGYVTENRCYKNKETGGWRVQFKLDPEKEDVQPIELRCRLKLTNPEKILSETWSYQWSR